jgi:DNA polymerase-1
MDKQQKPRLFLIDAYNMIYRSYYAFIKRPMINSKGLNTSAIYGFTNTLFEILRKYQPDYIAVVFDPPGPTFRDKLFFEYKATRHETPEAIVQSVPYIKHIIDAFGIPSFEIAGYEADDVIGTLATKAEKNGLTTWMITTDKDYSQLVSENIFIYKPTRTGNDFEIIGINEVKKIFEVDSPQQVIDILALWGDAVDNIPGAPGIGEKTAKSLIANYKSLNNLLENLGSLNDKQRSKLEENLAQIKMSKELVTICLEVPVELDFDRMKRGTWKVNEMAEIFNQLEFRTLYSRIMAANKQSVVQQSLFNDQQMHEDRKKNYNTIHSVPHNYHLVQETGDIKKLVEILSGLSSFCFDTETTGLVARHAELVGISFSFAAHEAYYIPFPSDRNVVLEKLELLKPVFLNENIQKVGQNLKYDMQILKNYNIFVKGKLFDTMIAHYLIQPDLRHSMDYLAEIYLNYIPVPIEELIGKKGSNQKNMRLVEISVIKEYACEDADITWQLHQLLEKELVKTGLSTLATKVEMPLVRVLTDMEDVGFNIDIKTLSNYSEVLKKELYNYEQEIFMLAGSSFNINSPKQLGEILFEKIKITDDAHKTKTNQYSTAEEVLSKLVNKHPIVQKILDYRALQKLLTTYVDSLPVLIDSETNRIHTSFEQAWVSTGRLSSKSPNLQNIPVRDERGKEIRKAFIPSDNEHVLVSADYSQIELRLMAHLSGDKNMIEAFLKDADIHTATACKIFKVQEAEVTRLMRTKAKTANFGIIYGISSFGLSQRLNISRAEASQLIKDYFATYPAVRGYMDSCIKAVKDKGYAETLMGRRRYLPDIHSANAIVRGVAERNAINTPIQGSAADIIKLAMVNIHNRLSSSFRSKMILQVHDELIFDTFLEELNALKELVRQEMENVVKLDVPLTIDIGMGSNWLEAH